MAVSETRRGSAGSPCMERRTATRRGSNAEAHAQVRLLRFVMPSGNRFWYFTGNNPNSSSGDFYRVRRCSSATPWMDEGLCSRLIVQRRR
jgi:hypothetical protein